MLTNGQRDGRGKKMDLDICGVMQDSTGSETVLFFREYGDGVKEVFYYDSLNCMVVSVVGFRDVNIEAISLYEEREDGVSFTEAPIYVHMQECISNPSLRKFGCVGVVNLSTGFLLVKDPDDFSGQLQPKHVGDWMPMEFDTSSVDVSDVEITEPEYGMVAELATSGIIF